MILDKAKMAHEWAMKHGKADSNYNRENTVQLAWEYADAMQAEADKREKEESERKRADIREMLKANNTFVEREGQHFDDVEWRPDWSQAPDSAMYWAMDGCGQCNWYEREPEVCGSQWDFGSVIEQTDTGYDYQGYWQDSLRKRP